MKLLSPSFPFGTALDKMNADSAPLMIVHGTSDGLVAFSNATALNDKCAQVGIPVAFYPLNGWGHEPWTASLNGKSIDDTTIDFLNANMTGIIAAARQWEQWK